MSPHPRPTPPRARQRGFVLLLVLGLMTVSFLVVVGFSQLARLELKWAARRQAHLTAYYLARGAMAQAQFALLAAWEQGLPFRLSADGSWQEVETGRGRAAYAIQEEEGKLDLNRVGAVMLARGLARLGLRGRRLEELRDAIMDWRDPDGVPRARGAEEEYYRGLNPPYAPRNAAFLSPGELTLVRGLDPGLVFGRLPLAPGAPTAAGCGLWSLFTIYARGRKVDLNQAPLAVLTCLPGLTPEIAAKLLRARRRRPFRSFRRLRQVVGDSAFRLLAPWATLAPGRIYTIVARAEVDSPRARHTILAVVYVTRRRLPRVLYWVDDVVQSPRPPAAVQGERR